MTDVGIDGGALSGETRVRRTRENDVAVLELFGQADLHVAPELRDRLNEAIDEGIGRIVVDFSRVTFLDSMTLGVLLGAVKRLRPRGGQLGIVVSDQHIRRIFEITLLDRVFPLYLSRAEAVERLA